MAKGIRSYLLATTLVVGGLLAFCGAALGSTHNALWQMEDPTQLLDDSGNNDGTTTNITGVEGVDGNGYQFDGAGSIATVPSSDSLNPGDADFAITVHVRFTEPPSTTVGDYDLIRKGLAATRGGDYKMEILPRKSNTQAKAFCFSKDSSKTVGKIVKGPNLADGDWHEVVCTKTSTEVQLTVDGRTYTNSVRLGSISNDEPVTIGAQTRSADWYEGDMDEVSVDTF
jgi:Concanavalin A-like lectin/glucanases superfamily